MPVLRFLFASLLLAAPLSAQTPDTSLVGTSRLGAEITAFTAVQTFEGESASGGSARVTQVSSPISLAVPLRPDLGLAVRMSYATSGGAGLTSVDGLADVQVGLSHRRRLGSGEAIFGLDVNLPNGDGTLTAAEAETAFLVGQGFYGFQMRTLGQGFNVAPSVAWAVPISPSAVVGVGAAVQRRGAFEPRRGASVAFDPGDELLVTTGVEVQAGSGVVGVDLAYAFYGDDTWGDVTFATGDEVSLTAQWAGALRGHDARLVGRFGRRETGTRTPETEALLGLNAVVPSQSRVLGSVRFQVGPRASANVYAQGRTYAASGAFASKAIADVGVEPALALRDGLMLLGRLGATVGDVRGVEVAAGIRWSR